MRNYANDLRVATLLMTLSLSACVRGDAMPVALAATEASVASVAAASLARTSAMPPMTVHKHESCGCCGLWIEHVQAAGFKVEVRNVSDLPAIKTRLGVPDEMASCHTAEVAGYFIEGHVPAADVKRLLAEKPDARGLALPGMPLGSPGMEHPTGRSQAYTVALVSRDGSTMEYSHHAPR